MKHISLGMTPQSDFKIMIFTEGTVLKPKSWLNLFNFKNYIPIGSCKEIIKGWWEQGADIVYCSSRKETQIRIIADLLLKYGFTGSELYYRGNGESYKDITEEIQPDILIEDDCRSIGGARQMCITKVAPDIKGKIVSIVVREYRGIDSLSRNINELKQKYTL